MSQGSALTTVAELDEDLLKQFDSQFKENVDQSEIRTSRLNLLQALSPECRDEKPGYKQGMFINHLTREIVSQFGPSQWLIDDGVPENEAPKCNFFPFIPVMKLPRDFIHWKPRKGREEGETPYYWKTVDANDPRVREGVWPPGGIWGTKADHNDPETGKPMPPPVTDNSNWLILPLDHRERSIKDSFLVQTFARSSAGSGKTLTTLLDGAWTTRRLRSFQTIFFMYSTLESFGKDKAYVAQIAKTKTTAREYCPDAYQIAAGMALWLTDNALGRARQLMLLNAHDPVEEETGRGGGSDSGDVLDSKGSSTEDPFPKGDEPAF